MKKIKLLAVLLVMSLILTGCGNSSKPEIKPAEEGTSASEEEIVHEPLTMMAPASWSYDDFVEALAKAYPEVKLNLVPLSTTNMTQYFIQSLSHGDIPDIYTSTTKRDADSMKKYLINLSGESFINSYKESALNEVAAEGNIYLLPSFTNIAGIYYNKTLVERYGLTLPGNYEELLAMKEQVETLPADENCAAIFAANSGKYAPEAVKNEGDTLELMRTRMDLDGNIFTVMLGLGATDFLSTPEGQRWITDFAAGRATAKGNLEPVIGYLQEAAEAGLINMKDYGNNSSNLAFMTGGALFHMCSQWSVYHWENADYGIWDYGIIPFLAKTGGDNMLISNTARYYGLSKALEEPGNEIKLEDAKKVLAFMSTPEGQKALCSYNNVCYSPVIGYELDADSPLKEVEDTLNRGYVMENPYSVFSEIIVDTVAKFYEMFEGKCTASEVCEAMDALNEERLAQGGLYLAKATETLTQEKTARLIAIAEAEAAQADAALISIASLVDCHTANQCAVSVPLYEGGITTEDVAMITPRSNKNVLTVALTGNQLKELCEKGFTPSGEDSEIFPYYVFIRNDAAIDGAATYVVAVPHAGLPTEYIEMAEDTGISAAKAVSEYLERLGTINAEALSW